MRILFLASAHNSLSQRLWIELGERGHEIRVLSISAIRLLVIALVASCATLLNTAAAEPLIATEQGRIRGIEMPSVRKFLGIPYAAPPVGTQGFTDANKDRWP